MSDNIDPLVLNLLKRRSMITRIITVSLVAILIFSAAVITILIASGNDSQKNSIERLLGIQRNKLEAGDLIFFNTPSNKHNVGIYLGKDNSSLPAENMGIGLSQLATTKSGNENLRSDQKQTALDELEDVSKQSAVKSKIMEQYASWVGDRQNINDSKFSKITESISQVLLNLSVIIFLGFVMRAVLVFIRYYMQLGTDYENQKLAYMLSSGNTSEFNEILTSLRENKINFEKTPSVPQEKIILAAIDILKKNNKDN